MSDLPSRKEGLFFIGKLIIHFELPADNKVVRDKFELVPIWKFQSTPEQE
jgi:hypothetical protein